LLKARQLGFTWLSLAYLLWRMVFYPIATVGLFSRGDDEAMELLDRLQKMYHRLPRWMQAERVVVNNAHRFEISTGSWARAFSTRKGESWTFSFLLLDEFDRFDYAPSLWKNVKPAADSGKSQIIIGSISDKDHPKTIFKNKFEAAWKSEDDLTLWFPIFLPWSIRPDRDDAWYEVMYAEALEDAGGDEAAAQDYMSQQYPGSVEEALAPRMQNKRIPYTHMKRVYKPKEPLKNHGGPAIPGLKVYRKPQSGHAYGLGADPAEGVEGGNDSALRILDVVTGEEVCALEGAFEPKKVFPKYIYELAMWYGETSILVERNNHGHAVLAELAELIAQKPGQLIGLLRDPADGREGWLTSPSGTGMTRGKVAMYDNGAQQIMDQQATIRDPVTHYQLLDIDLNKLKATSGEDDAADAWVLAATIRVIPGVFIKGRIMA
jgi:hypothetical protein